MKGLYFTGILLFILVFTPSAFAVGENFDTFCDPATESTNTSEYEVYENFEGTGRPSGWTFGSGTTNYDSTTHVFAGSEAVTGSGGYDFHSGYSTQTTGVYTYELFVYMTSTSLSSTGWYLNDRWRTRWHSDANIGYYNSALDWITVGAYNTSTWYKEVYVADWDNDNASIFIYNSDGDLVYSAINFNPVADYTSGANVFSVNTNMWVDNMRFYSGAVCPTAAVAPANSTNATERLQQNANVEQNGSVTVSGASYVPIITSSVTTDAGAAYAVASLGISGGSSANTATCRISWDGSEFLGSEASRSNTANSNGNLILSSRIDNVTAGSHDIGVDCYKSAGGNNFVVDNTSVLLHSLVSPDGNNLTYKELNFTGNVGDVYATTMTTSENATEVNLTRAYIADWTASIDYSATGNITITPEIAGTNCSSIVRYGTSGSTGSAASLCYVSGLTNDTSYDIKVHTAGSGTITGWLRVKETIIHPSEINSTDLTGTTITGSDTTSISLSAAAGHSTPDLIVGAGINPQSTSGSQESSFYLSGSSNSSTIIRTVGEGEPGSVYQQDVYSSFTSLTVSLVSSCASCSLTGGELVAYMSSDIAATPNEFIITAANSWDGTSLSEFDVTLSDGRSFSTTDGSINVPAGNGLLNITANEDSNAAIPYYSNTTNNHNTTGNIQLNLTAYTVINATYLGTKVNNFTANGTSTTSGKVYLRIFNTSTLVNITDAIADSGTNLSNNNATITASPYLEYYTFVMLTANTFNFSIYDELTETLITENMTIELITGASAGTYSTTNGTLLLELLTPSDYTIRYYETNAGNYTERDYIQTLVDRERYDISLYSLDVDEATDMIVTIKDTGGDAVESAVVKLLRYYTSCNCYQIVEMSQSSASGESYFIVDAYDGHYKFAVEYQGVTRFLSSSPENFIPSNNLVERTITINLGSAYFESYRELGDIARTLVYNNETKGLSFTWNDPSGIVTKGCLYAEYLDGVHYTAVTPACQDGSTGSVVLSLNNSVRSYLYYAELETSTTYSEYIVFSGSIDKVLSSLLAGNIALGAFLGVGVIIILALLFSFSAIAVVIITGVGVIAMAVLGVASLTTVFITGFVTLIIGIAAYLMRS